MVAGRLVSSAYQPSVAASASMAAWSKCQSRVVAGAVEFFGAGGSGAGRGVDEHPAHRVRRVFLAGPGDGHGVLDDAVAAALFGRAGGVAFGDVGHRTAGGGGGAGLDLLEIGPAVLRMTELGLREVGVTGRVVAVEADRGHVPVQLRHVDAVRPDRGRPDRAGHLLGHRRQRIQRPRDAVVVEHARIQAQRVLDGELARPRRHVDHRRRCGQPVGDQRLDHLPVCGVGDLARRNRPVDDARDVQPSAQPGRHRQRPQHLLGAGRTVPNPHRRLLACHTIILNDIGFKMMVTRRGAEVESGS